MISTRSILAWLTFATATAYLSYPARAGWRVVGQIGGPISAVAVRGTAAYVAVGLRLYVYDVSDPGAPREVGATPPFGDFISDVEVAGSRAYVTAGKDGLHILDLSDPVNPRAIGRWNTPGSAEGIAVAGNVAYVADGPFGIQIVDVSDPGAPRILSTGFETFFAFDVIMNGSIIYVAAAGAGVLVLDAGDPSQPRELPIIDTPGYARGLAISSTTLYVADEWGGIRIMDVATPTQPRETGTIPVQSWAFAVAVSGSTLYVAAGSQGLHVYDLSHPEQQRVAVYDVPSNLSWKVALLRDRAFLGVRTQGVTIIDVRNPSSPQLLGAISPLSNAQAVAARGNIAFVTTESQGMRVVDLTDVQRPRERGRGEIFPDDIGTAIVVNENRAYTCSAGLRVYDTSNPEQPVLLGSARALEGCRDLVVRGTSLYLASETELEMWDASNPAAPALSSKIGFPVSGVDRTAGVEGVDVVGSTAFVDREKGVSAIDVSNPRSPILLGSLATGSQTSDVCADGQHVYLVTGGGGLSELYVVDVKNPAQLVLVGTAPIPAPGLRVVIHDKKAYVAVGAAGVAVVDVSVASAPIPAERISLPGFAKELAFAGERLLVASSDGGLFIVERTSTPSSTPLNAGVIAAPLPSPPKLPLRRNAIASVQAIPVEQQRISRAAARSIVVTSTEDSGAGTLRAALAGLQAGDTITFDPLAFLPSAPATIRPQSRLPAISTDAITVDASNAGVILDGSALSGQHEPGIEIVSRGNTIKGLQIFNFPFAGILLSGKGGNTIGGDRSRGTGPSGEGNVISRNRESGIFILNPNENRIVGNLIGTDVTGREALGRQYIGVRLFYQAGNGTDTAPDRIGGSEPWEANVIAGNDAAEVYLQEARGHAVIGNFLGTDSTGSSRVGSSLVALGALSSAGNVIASNVMVGNQYGMFVIDPGSHCNLVANNWIGVTKDGVPLTNDPYWTGIAVYEPFNAVVGNTSGASISLTNIRSNPAETVIIGNTIGTRPLPNNPPGQQAGVRIDSAWLTFIGGATEAERNVIGGKTIGIWIKTPGLDRTFIMGNTIHDTVVGVDAGSASSSIIQGNTITNNQRGVMISAPTNRLRRNSIYANDIAITIDGDGTSPPPVITDVTLNTVRGNSCARCVVEIFSDAGIQGRWYEGSVTADAAGTFSFTTAATLRGPNLTATATDAEASTSAFSAPVARPTVGPRRRAARH